MPTKSNQTFDFQASLGQAPDKSHIEEALKKVLPENAFTVIVRNYSGGDARSMLSQREQSRYQVLITVLKESRPLVLQHRGELEGMGFTVSDRGGISLN